MSDLWTIAQDRAASHGLSGETARQGKGGDTGQQAEGKTQARGFGHAAAGQGGIKRQHRDGETDAKQQRDQRQRVAREWQLEQEEGNALSECEWCGTQEWFRRKASNGKE